MLAASRQAAEHCRRGGHLIEMKRLRVELTCEPLDLCLVEHLPAAGEALSDMQVVEVINCQAPRRWCRTCGRPGAVQSWPDANRSTPDQTAAGRPDRLSSRLRRNADGTACSMSLRLSTCDNIWRTVVSRHMSLQGMPAADWGAGSRRCWLRKGSTRTVNAVATYTPHASNSPMAWHHMELHGRKLQCRTGSPFVVIIFFLCGCQSGAQLPPTPVIGATCQSITWALAARHSAADSLWALCSAPYCRD